MLLCISESVIFAQYVLPTESDSPYFTGGQMQQDNGPGIHFVQLILIIICCDINYYNIATVLIDEVFKDEEEIDEGKNLKAKLCVIVLKLCNTITENGVSDHPNVIGDMVLTPEQMKQLESGEGLEGTAQAFHLTARRWPNGVFPYKIDGSIGMEVVHLLFAISVENSSAGLGTGIGTSPSVFWQHSYEIMTSDENHIKPCYNIIILLWALLLPGAYDITVHTLE